MSKKKNIEMNRSDMLEQIDDELEDALAKLDATTGRIDEVLNEAPDTPSNSAAVVDEEASAAPDRPDDGPDAKLEDDATA